MHPRKYIHIVLWGTCIAVSVNLLNLRDPAITLYEVDEDDEEGDEDEVHSVVGCLLAVWLISQRAKGKT